MEEGVEEAIAPARILQSAQHTRYRQQAGWTLETRRYLFEQNSISAHAHLLEAGCGSGAVLDTLAQDGYDHLVGIDIDLDTFFETEIQRTHACADGLTLPFSTNSFTHSLCHFYLLWVHDPLTALKEMARVTQPGGYVLALAEPDYGGRISYPHALEQAAVMQTRALALRGADVHIGRHLLSLFTEAGLKDIQVGIIPAHCGGKAQYDAFMEDRGVLAQDLAGLIDSDALDSLAARAKESAPRDAWIWFVPIFHAVGRVPYENEG